MKEVVKGRGSAVFKRFATLHAEELSFSVYFAEDNSSIRTLDLVCKARAESDSSQMQGVRSL